MECLGKLNNPVRENRVALCWMRGHIGICSNEKAKQSKEGRYNLVCEIGTVVQNKDEYPRKRSKRQVEDP